MKILSLFCWLLKFTSCSLIVIVNLRLSLARTKEMIAKDYDNEENAKIFKFKRFCMLLTFLLVLIIIYCSEYVLTY